MPQREPHLERAKLARQLEPVVGEPRRAGGRTARRPREICGIRRERIAMRELVAEEHAAHAVRRVQPFVRVERERVGAFDPAHQMRVRGTRRGQRAERAVDVQPQAFFRADVRERAEVVERAGVDAARGADDQERTVARGAIGGDPRAQRLRIERAPVVHVDQPQRRGPEACDAQRLGDAVVHAARGIGRQARAGDPVRARVRAQRGVACGGDREQVAHRRPARQDPARIRRESEELREPRDHLALDVDRGVLAPADVRVHPGGEQLGQHARRGSRAVHPAEEARVAVARRVRAHELVERRERRADGFAVARQRFAQRALHRVGDGAPRRFVAQPREVVHDAVDGVVQHAAKLAPVGGVERLAGHARIRRRTIASSAVRMRGT